MEQIYTPKQDYKVFVRCNTFNQSKYIEDALNGFAIQQTNFPFVCMIMDDCSTDGEQEVIKAWMERECDMDKAEYVELEMSNVILVPHKTNENCTFAIYLLKQNLYGTGDKKMKHVFPWREHCEYEAICEGDDYWVDSQKLQTQIDYMDAHPDCSMTFHRVLIKNESSTMSTMSKVDIEDRDYSDNEIFENWIVPTASVVIRKEVQKIPIIGAERVLYGDIFIFLRATKVGKVHGMSKEMACYRINNNGVTRNPAAVLKADQKKVDHLLCIKENFPGLDISKKLQLAFCRRAECQQSHDMLLNDYKSAYKISKIKTISFFIENRIIRSLKDLVKIIINY